MSARAHLLALALLLPAAAWADVAPPDHCAEEDFGKACGNAGPNGNERGACAEATCSKLDYSDRDESGVPRTVEYNCLRCEVDAEPISPEGSSAGGCGMAPRTSEGLIGASMCALGVAAFFWSRRRRA